MHHHHHHRELIFFQDITDTIQNEAPIDFQVQPLAYSFLCGSSLFFLHTVYKRHMLQFELNLDRREWEEAKQMMSGDDKLNFFSIASCGETIYSYGGSDMWFYVSVAELRRFDPVHKDWNTVVPSVKSESQGAEHPGFVHCPRSGSRGDCLVAYGGYSDMDSLYLSELNIFYMDSKEWITMPCTEKEGPGARVDCAVVHVPQRDVVIMYGGKRETELYDVWSLDMKELRWTLVTDVVTGDAPTSRLTSVQLSSTATIVVPSFDKQSNQVVLYMLNGETLHWTSYRTGLSMTPLYLSVHELPGDSCNRMVLFVRNSPEDNRFYVIGTPPNTPVMFHNLHRVVKQKVMCDVVIDFCA